MKDSDWISLSRWLKPYGGQVNSDLTARIDLEQYIAPRKETKTVSETTKKIDEVKSTVANLEGQVAKLKEQNEWQSRQITLQAERLKPSGKQALYIRLDGATQIKPPMVEPSPDYPGYQPMRYYRQAVLRSGYIRVSGYESPFASVPTENEEFRLIAETQAYYVYEQVR